MHERMLTLFILYLPDHTTRPIYMYTKPSDLLQQLYSAPDAILLIPSRYKSRSGVTFHHTYRYNPATRSLEPLDRPVPAVLLFRIDGRQFESGPGTGKLSRSLEITRRVALAIANLLNYHSLHADGRSATPDFVVVSSSAIEFYERVPNDCIPRFALTVEKVLSQGNLKVYKIKEQLVGFCPFDELLYVFDHELNRPVQVLAEREPIAYIIKSEEPLTVKHPEHEDLELVPGTYLLYHPIPRRARE